METGSIDKFERWIDERELPPNLASEMQYYLHEVEREYTLTLAEGVHDWYDRHETDPKAGWLNKQDVRFIREGFVATGIAQRLDRLEPWQCTRPKSERLWFTMDGVEYEYDPD